MFGSCLRLWSFRLCFGCVRIYEVLGMIFFANFLEFVFRSVCFVSNFLDILRSRWVLELLGSRVVFEVTWKLGLLIGSYLGSGNSYGDGIECGFYFVFFRNIIRLGWLYSADRLLMYDVEYFIRRFLSGWSPVIICRLHRACC